MEPIKLTPEEQQQLDEYNRMRREFMKNGGLIPNGQKHESIGIQVEADLTKFFGMPFSLDELNEVMHSDKPFRIGSQEPIQPRTETNEQRSAS